MSYWWQVALIVIAIILTLFLIALVYSACVMASITDKASEQMNNLKSEEDKEVKEKENK